MKTIVLFATKSGAAGECAALLAEKLNCPSCNLMKASPDISGFDMIILGSGIRIGRIYRPASKFIKRNLDQLLSKKCAIYFCNGEPDTFQKAIEKNIPAELASKAACIESFGGRPPFSSAPISGWLNTDSVERLLEAVGRADSGNESSITP